NWDSEGVGSKAAALVDLSTVAGNKISNPPWVKFQSAGWVNFPSAPTIDVLVVDITDRNHWLSSLAAQNGARKRYISQWAECHQGA
ncbi:MAG: hypothetical protein ACK561_03295, partial [Pseudomonadaceae bacterium]